MLNKDEYGEVYLLVGKVASGKTTFARVMQAKGGGIFLSIDELQLAIFGEHPTREQLDSSYEGCFEYQKRLALNLLKNGLDVYLDWGFWRQELRHDTHAFFKQEQVTVYQYYFDIPLSIRYERNRKRNLGCDQHSHKIEEKDIAFFDSLFEAPKLYENDRVFMI